MTLFLATLCAILVGSGLFFTKKNVAKAAAGTLLGASLAVLTMTYFSIDNWRSSDEGMMLAVIMVAWVSAAVMYVYDARRPPQAQAA